MGAGLVLASILPTMAEAMMCVAIWTQTTVCVTAGSDTTCSHDYYVDDYWCSGGGGGGGGTGGDGGGGGGGGGGDAPPYNPADGNDNGIIDHWRSVLQTQDPCGSNFDANDRLGTNYGGPNTQRVDHKGVDIQADEGDPVSVVRDGQITFIGWQDPSNHGRGCGFHMRVVHTNGDSSVYCHLVGGSNTWELGNWVRAGAVIAAADSTGNSTGHHLHLIYHSKQTGSPAEYFDFTDTAPTSQQLDPNGC